MSCSHAFAILSTPHRCGGLPGESVPRQRWAHDMEGVFGAYRTSRVGQRFDHFVERHDRTRPAVVSTTGKAFSCGDRWWMNGYLAHRFRRRTGRSG